MEKQLIWTMISNYWFISNDYDNSSKIICPFEIKILILDNFKIYKTIVQ